MFLCSCRNMARHLLARPLATTPVTTGALWLGCDSERDRACVLFRPAQSRHRRFLEGTFQPEKKEKKSRPIWKQERKKKVCDVWRRRVALHQPLWVEGRAGLAPTFPACVSDDPLNSSGGIKGNCVNITKIHSTHC